MKEGPSLAPPFHSFFLSLPFSFMSPLNALLPALKTEKLVSSELRRFRRSVSLKISHPPSIPPAYNPSQFQLLLHSLFLSPPTSLPPSPTSSSSSSPTTTLYLINPSQLTPSLSNKTPPFLCFFRFRHISRGYESFVASTKRP